MTNSSKLPAADLTAGSSPQSQTLPLHGFVRQWQVLRHIPFSKSTLWRRIQAKTFPQPIKLSERVTVWRAEQIREWIEAQSTTVDETPPAAGTLQTNTRVTPAGASRSRQ
jgi:prophage regulatory protein